MARTCSYYHYFQCLDCPEAVVVSLRRQTLTPNMTLPCPCCASIMICDGTNYADLNGYEKDSS